MPSHPPKIVKCSRKVSFILTSHAVTIHTILRLILPDNRVLLRRDDDDDDANDDAENADDNANDNAENTDDNPPSGRSFW